jgi:hypothetical protein
MESNRNNLVAETGGVDAAVDRSAIPPAIVDRDVWLDSLADVHSEMDRRFDTLNRRIARAESRHNSWTDMPDEVRGLLVMLAVYVGVSIILPMIGEWVSKWRAQHSS